jgi:hypothetical protein
MKTVDEWLTEYSAAIQDRLERDDWWSIEGWHEPGAQRFKGLLSGLMPHAKAGHKSAQRAVATILVCGLCYEKESEFMAAFDSGCEQATPLWAEAAAQGDSSALCYLTLAGIGPTAEGVRKKVYALLEVNPDLVPEHDPILEANWREVCEKLYGIFLVGNPYPALEMRAIAYVMRRRRLPDYRPGAHCSPQL